MKIIETSQEEAEAIRRCQQGDISGLEPLVLRYQTHALRTAYLIVRDRQLAEDIVQDSFLTAYSHITQFDTARLFAPWFYRIVINTARQSLRAATRRPTVHLQQGDATDAGGVVPGWEEPPDDSLQYDPVIQAERSMEQVALLDALATLTVKQREAVVLRYYCDLNDQEMAHLLNCLPGTARWRLHSGLRALERVIWKKFPSLLQKLGSADAPPTDETKAAAFAERMRQ